MYQSLVRSNSDGSDEREGDTLLSAGDQPGQRDDVVALRRFLGMTQQSFSAALGISVHTLRNWEQGRRKPEGPALALLRIGARHPRVLLDRVISSAAREHER